MLTPESDDHSSLVDALAAFQTRGRTPVIASGGLTPSNVSDVVTNYPVFGVDARAGVESAPGVKDAVRLGEFIARRALGLRPQRGRPRGRLLRALAP